MDSKLKSGLFTTEFVTTIITQIVTFLVAIGVIDAGQSNFWAEAITRIVFGIIGLITVLAYIRGRIELKKQEMSVVR